MQLKEITELNEVLARERTALLTAEYGELASLSALKEQLLHDLGTLQPSLPELAHLKSEMKSNLDLTSAALRGVMTAKERIEALQKVRDGLTTYDQSGNVANLSNTHRKIEKKA
jgi:flagellar biosynthesis/type III secretory pathway chaperone